MDRSDGRTVLLLPGGFHEVPAKQGGVGLVEELEDRDVQAGRIAGLIDIRVLRPEGVRAGADQDGVAGSWLDGLRFGDVLEFPAVDGLLERDVVDVPVTGDIVEDAAGDDAAAPGVDGVGLRTIVGDV